MADRPATAAAVNIDWRQIHREIIAGLDLAHEFRELGVKLAATQPSASGWLACYSVTRDEAEPSAAVNVAGPDGKRGLYVDLGAGRGQEEKASLFEFAAKLAPSPPPSVKDWRDAREYYAAKSGVVLPKIKKKKRGPTTSPATKTATTPERKAEITAQPVTDPVTDPVTEQVADTTPPLMQRLDPLPWIDVSTELFCRQPSKRGITREGLLAAGAFLARRLGVPVVSVPCFRCDADFLAKDQSTGELTAPTPTGCAMWSQSGGKLILKTKHGKPTTHKILQYGAGWFGLDGLRRLAAWRQAKPKADAEPAGEVGAEAPAKTKTLWIAEGPSDMLAVWAAIPEAERKHHAVTSNSAGARQSLDARLLAMLPAVADSLLPAGFWLRVCVLKDRDEAGEEGAKKWTRRLASTLGADRLTAGHMVVAPVLPYPLAKKSGNDARDFFNDGHSFDDLERLASEAEPIAASEASATDESAEQPAGEEGDSDGDGNGRSGGRKSRRKKSNDGDGDPNAFGNVIRDGDDDEAPTEPKPLNAAVADLFERTGNWPRRVDADLFIHDEQQPEKPVLWLKDSPQLFAWIGSKLGEVRWSNANFFVPKIEFFAALQQLATKCEAVETLPHEPPLAGHYYACRLPQPEPDDVFPDAREFADDSPEQFCGVLGEHFAELVGRFRGHTPLDQWLIAAFFATPFWGGAPGTRPAFLVTADEGRGSGKSKLTEMLSRLLGGILDFSAKEEWQSMIRRIMSDKGTRLARIDNLKSEKFSHPEIESLITSFTLSGDAKWKNNMSAPNRLTWVITGNGPSLSTDMAQRSVTIKLRRPEYAPNWESETVNLIESRRAEIVADIVRFLRRPAAHLTRSHRWAHWEHSILGRLPSANELLALVKLEGERANADRGEFEMLEGFVSDRLTKLEYDPSEDQIQIPLQILADWYGETYRSKKIDVRWVTRKLNQAINEGEISNFRYSRTNAARFFWWVGSKNGRKFTDLEERISNFRGSWR